MLMSQLWMQQQHAMTLSQDQLVCMLTLLKSTTSKHGSHIIDRQTARYLVQLPPGLAGAATYRPKHASV